MLSRLANLALVLTALAPIAIIYGFALVVESNDWGWAFMGGAALLAGICWGLLRAATLHGQREDLPVTKTKPVDKEVLTFLIAYLLPLIVRKQTGTNSLVMIPVVLILFFVIHSAHIVHVNPLMTFLRYHFYEVGTPSGATYLLITRDRRPKSEGNIRAVRLSPHTWLEVAS